jgi:hypothetical protein
MYCTVLDISGMTRALTGTVHDTRGPVSSSFEPPQSPPQYRHSSIHLVRGHYDERRRECEADQRRPQMVRFRGVESVTRINELTPDSIQEALRMYFQPMKSNDPKLDFYTMYKRETMEYDTEYMQKYNEDLNTTLIFVRFWVPFTTKQR